MLADIIITWNSQGGKTGNTSNRISPNQLDFITRRPAVQVCSSLQVGNFQILLENSLLFLLHTKLIYTKKTSGKTVKHCTQGGSWSSWVHATGEAAWWNDCDGWILWKIVEKVYRKAPGTRACGGKAPNAWDLWTPAGPCDRYLLSLAKAFSTRGWIAFARLIFQLW